MAIKQAFIIFTKEPIVGKVKTRLARTIGENDACEIYKLLLENLINLKLEKSIDIFIAVDSYTKEYQRFFPNLNLFLQEGKNIGEKMSNSFKNIFSKDYEKVVLVGGDIPLLDEKIIADAFNELRTFQAVISKTEDKGYYLIGFQKESFSSKAFEIDFSNDVYNQTLNSLKNLNVKEGIELFDIDEIEDLRKFANLQTINTNFKLFDYSKNLLKSFPRISVIIPVYFEKENFPNTIKHLIENSKNNDFEIIVCDTPNRTTIDDINCSYIKAVVSNKAGRANQLNYGSKCAKGEIFLFLHADTLLPKNWDEQILNLYEKNKNLAGAFKLGIKTENLIIKAIEFLANIRVIFTNTPYGDQGQFFSSKLFNNINGYDEIPLMEDIEIIKRVHRKNLKVKIIDEKIYTSDRRWKKEGIFYTSIRNRILSTLYFFGVSSENLKKYYKF